MLPRAQVFISIGTIFLTHASPLLPSPSPRKRTVGDDSWSVTATGEGAAFNAAQFRTSYIWDEYNIKHCSTKPVCSSFGLIQLKSHSKFPFKSELPRLPSSKETSRKQILDLQKKLDGSDFEGALNCKAQFPNIGV